VPKTCLASRCEAAIQVLVSLSGLDFGTPAMADRLEVIPVYVCGNIAAPKLISKKECLVYTNSSQKNPCAQRIRTIQ
jgi:hypothetical protein